MAQLGIETGLDLKDQTLEFLQQYFGKAGSYYYWAARGIDERPVRADRIRKSVGAENTFPVDLFTYEAARDALRETVDKVWGYCTPVGYRLLHGCPHSFRFVGGCGDADLLRVGRSQPNVHLGLRGVLRPRFRLWIPARGVALRITGGNLVAGRRTAMA